MKKNLSLLVLIFHTFYGSVVFAFPKIHDWNTDEGARVLYIHAPELPMVDMIIAMDAGKFREKEQYGLASMTASMMTLGTKSLDEHAFSETLENIGSTLSVSTNITTTMIRLRSLTEESPLTKTLAVLEEMITAPRFDENIFIREREQAIDAQKVLLDNPSSIAQELYYHALYPNSVLGITSEMLKASLASLELSSLKAFQQQYYHATNAKIIIIGDINEEKAKEISKKISKTLGKGGSLPKISEPIAIKAPQTITQHFNSPQSQILIGHPSINRFDEDFLTLILGNYALGGSGLTSLLMEEIRDKQGLTYGIYSSLNASFLNGPFTISLSTKNERKEHAINATIKLINEFIINGPSDESLKLAKNSLAGSTIVELSSNSSLASALLTIAIYDLPLDYYDTYPERIQAITKEDIQKAFKRHIQPQKFTTVIVGGDS